MKVQYSYLKNFLSTNLSQVKLADIFTKVGFECELDKSIIEFDITPNRGDALSLRGLQREFNAHQSKKLKDTLSYSKLNFKKDKAVINKIDSTGCGNYNLMVIKGIHSIKNLDSKKKNFLLAAGVPLINPLVDLGNYVMLEIGSPMHVFDFDLLDLPINVMFKSIEKPFQAIGGDYKNLDVSSLTIHDQSGVQAVAGIIGGEQTSVSKKTTNIAVEAAFFYPEKIVNQARKYGLATDASHRFERGVDPTIQKKALERFLFLLSSVAEYESVNSYEGNSKPLKLLHVPLSVDRFNNFSGLGLSAKTISGLLENLGFDLIITKKPMLSFAVPSHRFDISLEEDLYEEILRCYGYDNIPIKSPKIGPILPVKAVSRAAQLRLGLVSAGFMELMHMPFVSDITFAQLNHESWKPARLLNPINEDEPLMRGSLFGSLFRAVNANIKKGYSSIRVFEEGNVFRQSAKSFIQETHLSGIVYHHENMKTWGQKEWVYDLYSMKANILQLIQTIGVSNIQLKKNLSSKVFNLNAIDIFSKGKKIGVFGEINLSATGKLLKKTAYGFEFYLSKIKNNSTASSIKLSSKFPLSSRDINIIVSKSHPYHSIETILSSKKINYLEYFQLINTYEGPEVPKDAVSYTIRLVFQSNKKSLSEEEINGAIAKTLELLFLATGAKIRS